MALNLEPWYLICGCSLASAPRNQHKRLLSNCNFERIWKKRKSIYFGDEVVRCCWRWSSRDVADNAAVAVVVVADAEDWVPRMLAIFSAKLPLCKKSKDKCRCKTTFKLCLCSRTKILRWNSLLRPSKIKLNLR